MGTEALAQSDPSLGEALTAQDLAGATVIVVLWSAAPMPDIIAAGFSNAAEVRRFVAAP